MGCAPSQIRRFDGTGVAWEETPKPIRPIRIPRPQQRQRQDSAYSSDGMDGSTKVGSVRMMRCDSCEGCSNGSSEGGRSDGGLGSSTMLSANIQIVRSRIG